MEPVWVCGRRVVEMKSLAFVIGLALIGVGIAACGDGAADSVSAREASAAASPASDRLDCGSGKAGSEEALRQFVAILRRGDRSEVRAVLVDRPRFAWLYVGFDGRRRAYLDVPDDPDKAARAVARRGGLPLTISEFGNSEPPRRTTDFGFKGRWNGTRHLNGKAAIDCNQGKAIVLGVGVRRR
jgi:hypothetical protein